MLKLTEIKKYFSCNLAIDLGTSKTVIIDPERGVLIDEATAVAIHEYKGQTNVIAVGNKALEMVGKESRGHKVVFPLKNGVIFDADIAEVMLTSFIDTAMSFHPNKLFKPNPKIVITVPCYATQLEKRSVKDLALKAGASEVRIIEQSLAAAFGSDLDIDTNNGHIMVHIGAGVTEVAILSMNDIVSHHTIECGGNHFTDAIKQHFRVNHKISLSTEVAERIKIELGSALLSINNETNSLENDFLSVSAVDIYTNLPKEVVINQTEVYKAISSVLAELINGFMESIVKMSPEIASDVFNNGIHLSGGGAKLSNLKDFFKKITSLKVNLVDDPDYVVVKGCVSCLINGDLINE